MFKLHHNAIDISNKKFGRLTVIKPVFTTRFGIYWKCKCKCGNIKNILTTRLLRNITKSCGCLLKEYLKNQNQKGKYNGRFIDNRTNVKHYCIQCHKNVISLSNFFAGKRRCLKCKSKGKNNPRFGKMASHGKGKNYKGIFMRSSWETKYAKYLDKNHIKWQYEPKTFDLGNSTYTPDFYLPKTNKYIEIKGWWRDDAKKKFNKFKKLYLKTRIEVLYQKDLKQLKILK